MRKNTRAKTQRRQTLDKLIANAKTPLEEMALAFYGPSATERNSFVNRLALQWRALRDTRKRNEPAEALYGFAKGDLELFTLSAMWNDWPEALEALALAMRRASRGEFDPIGPINKNERAALLLGHSPAKLAKELTRGNKAPTAAESKERSLRRIKARIIRHPDK